MNTDDALAYYHMSKEFAVHGVVNHSKDEYVSKDGQTHIQSMPIPFDPARKRKPTAINQLRCRSECSSHRRYALERTALFVRSPEARG